MRVSSSSNGNAAELRMHSPHRYRLQSDAAQCSPAVVSATFWCQERFWLAPEMISDKRESVRSQGDFLKHWTLVLALLIHGSAPAFAGVGFMFRDGFEIREGLLPIYVEETTEPCAFIRVGRLHKDFQTRGFFRIGVLPSIRAEKVEFVIKDSGQLTTVLAEIRPLILGRGSRGSFEMQDVTFLFEGELLPRLVAPRVRLAESGEWDFVDGCQVTSKGRLIHLQRSRMAISGPNVGRVSTIVDGRAAVFHPFSTEELSEDK